MFYLNVRKNTRNNITNLNKTFKKSSNWMYHERDVYYIINTFK